jgi:hypothetical protein
LAFDSEDSIWIFRKEVEMTEVEALQKIASELSSLFWLIFWFGILGAFGTTVNNEWNKR